MDSGEPQIAIDKLPDFIKEFTTCAICYGILQDAIETACHHLFCHNCLNLLLQNRPICPNCRDPVTREQCKRNVPIQKLADQIPMTCTYKINGCDASPASKDFATHIRNCEYKEARQIAEDTHELEKMVSQAYDVLKQDVNRGKTMLDAIKTNNIEIQMLIKLNKAYHLYLTGKVEEAQLQYTALLEELLRSHGENHKNVIECYEKLALICKKLGNERNYRLAIAYLTKIIGIIRNSADFTETKIINYKSQLADIKRKIDDYDGAEIDYQTALLHANLDIDKATLHRGLGIICKKRDDYDGAMQHYSDALRLLDKPDTMQCDVGIILLDIGDIYRKREKHIEALTYYDKSYKHVIATRGATALDMVDIYYSMSLSFNSLNRLPEAHECLKRAKDIMSHVKELNYKSGLLSSGYGTLSSQQGFYHVALGQFTESLDILTKTLGPDHLEVADVRLKLVEAALKEQEETKQKANNDELLGHIRSALQTYRAKFNATHSKISECETFLYLLTNSFT